MGKNTSVAEMLADLADRRRDKLERYLGEDEERAKIFWEFFGGAYAARIPLTAAVERWEQDYGPLPCSPSHLRNVVARQKHTG